MRPDFLSPCLLVHLVSTSYYDHLCLPDPLLCLANLAVIPVKSSCIEFFPSSQTAVVAALRQAYCCVVAFSVEPRAVFSLLSCLGLEAALARVGEWWHVDCWWDGFG